MAPLPSPYGVGHDPAVRRTMGWSIAVVLLAGIGAAFTTSPAVGRSVHQQGLGPVVPAVQADGAVVAETGGGAGVPTPGSTPLPATAGPSPVGPTAGARGGPAPAAGDAAAKAKAKAAAGSTPAAAAAAAAAAAGSATRLQPDAGTYPLRISGTSAVDGKASVVPSSGSLVVSSGSDQQQRTVGVPGDLVLVQRASAAGIDLVSFSLTAGSKTLTFRGGSPLAFVRTSPGASWSWSVRSTDGTVGLSQTAVVTSAGSVSVDGAQVPAVTVQRMFTVSGAASGTVQLTSTVSTVDRLPLVQHQAINVTATVLGLLSTHVVSDATATLTTTRPS